ncbi:MAG TPA: pyridoxal kinase [Hyphomicrobiaceae bacterium]|nr:pyridoxal kinase [Hyphomicrobiaceae bacterium]
MLAISSQVTRGHVGLSATVPALRRLGHEVWALPTIVLSNHPGHKHSAGTRIQAAALQRMVDALDRNGWLGEIDAVLTGYLPSVSHVAFAAQALVRIKARRPDITYLCDPVMGDEPKGLYIEAGAAAAIRDVLVPRADIATPNRFELSFLACAPIEDGASAARASAALGVASVLTKSLPGRLHAERINLMASPKGTYLTRVPLREKVPHGVGDLMAGLLLGHLLNGASPGEALAKATAAVDAALEASGGADELKLADWDAVSEGPGWPIEGLSQG